MNNSAEERSMNIFRYIKALFYIGDVEAFWIARDIIVSQPKKSHIFMKLLCKVVNKHYCSSIPISSKVNEFNTVHGFCGIFISTAAVIGKNCTIFQHVTLGSNYLDGPKMGGGAPVIGDNCFIGVGAKIIGKVKVGNNVRIGAGAIVVEDVPENCTVVMDKPRVICRG